ncbi:MAG TPA: hypothetical protein VN541_22900, partial [Tepidisphaeraceae bacterium]|nr:hypothetical protein [Tepidisphaeraceae bacterium]
SLVLGSTLDKIGHRLRLTEALLGLITALGADAPEISSAITAVVAGKHDAGVGVLLGASILNIAALLGLSAVVAGKVRVGKQGLVLDGTVSLLIVGITLALIRGFISPVVSVVLCLVVLGPYVVVSGLGPARVTRLPLPRAMHRFFDQAAVNLQHDSRKDMTPPRATTADVLTIVPVLLTIIVGSEWMVRAALRLSSRWGMSEAILGTLVLAPLTVIPNVVTAVRLALHGRGAAVVSEALNSNTFNLLIGLCLTAAILGLPRGSEQTLFCALWLLCLTALALLLTARRGGLLRAEGIVLILIYGVFVAWMVWAQ